MGYKLNGVPLSLDVAFTSSDGTQYPSSWLRNSTAADRAAVASTGITWEADPPWYDQRFYWGVNKPKSLTDIPTYDSYDDEGKGIGSATGSQPGLKSIWVQKQKDIANSLLAHTDWKVIRAAEGGTAVPSADKTYRGNVRTQCGLREATINACADVDKLAATLTGTLSPTIAGTASNGATEKKKEDGSSYDPIQYNDVANPDLLEDWPTS